MMSSSNSDRKITHVRDLFSNSPANIHHSSTTTNTNSNHKYRPEDYSFNNNNNDDHNRTRHKYKTLERHLSMKKTIRKKMMRDLREIGDATDNVPDTFLDKLKSDLPPTANIDKPSFWKRLTKSWTSSSTNSNNNNNASNNGSSKS